MGFGKVPLFATLFWTAITGVFLVVVGYGLGNQCRTLYFASTTGTVDSIVQTVHHGKSTTYGVAVSYHYTVNDRRYDSDRLRYMQGSSSRQWAAEWIGRLPVGSHPTVYYNASDPRQAVLIRGPEGMDLFLALFMTPFTLVMVMMWVGTVQRWRKTKGFLGLRILEADAITRIRPSGWMAVGMGVMALGVSAFVGIFVVVIGLVTSDNRISLALPGGVWVGVLSIGAGAAIYKYGRIRSGYEDVTLDDRSALLTAPGGLQIPYDKISGVHVKTTVSRSSKGQSTTTYEVWLRYEVPGRAAGDLKLEKWTEQEEEARRFAAWLGLRVGVAVGDGTEAAEQGT